MNMKVIHCETQVCQLVITNFLRFIDRIFVILLLLIKWMGMMMNEWMNDNIKWRTFIIRIFMTKDHNRIPFAFIQFSNLFLLSKHCENKKEFQLMKFNWFDAINNLWVMFFLEYDHFLMQLESYFHQTCVMNNCVEKCKQIFKWNLILMLNFSTFQTWWFLILQPLVVSCSRAK